MLAAAGLARVTAAFNSPAPPYRVPPAEARPPPWGRGERGLPARPGCESRACGCGAGRPQRPERAGVMRRWRCGNASSRTVSGAVARCGASVLEADLPRPRGGCCGCCDRSGCCSCRSSRGEQSPPGLSLLLYPLLLLLLRLLWLGLGCGCGGGGCSPSCCRCSGRGQCVLQHYGGLEGSDASASREKNCSRRGEMQLLQACSRLGQHRRLLIIESRKLCCPGERPGKKDADLVSNEVKFARLRWVWQAAPSSKARSFSISSRTCEDTCLVGYVAGCCDLVLSNRE